MTKSKQISKIIVATCSQGLYGVIEDADSKYDNKYKFNTCVCSRAARASEARESQLILNLHCGYPTPEYI